MYKNFHLRIYGFFQFPDNINNENLSVAILSLTSWSAWSNDKGLSLLPADPLKCGSLTPAIEKKCHESSKMAYFLSNSINLLVLYRTICGIIKGWRWFYVRGYHRYW